MSRRSYTRHVPDVRMITHYAETGHSTIHSMTAWAKAAILLLIVAMVTVATDLYVLMMIFAFTLCFYALARLPIRLLIGWYTMPVFFVLTIAIMFVFTEPGEDIARLELGSTTIGVTDNGLILMAKLLLRALAVVTFSLATFMTTRYGHVVYIAHRTLPSTIASMFLLTYRFLFVTSDELTNILDTVHSRNGHLARGVFRQTRMFAGIFTHAFVHAFERGERISKAMEARGFLGAFPVSEGIPKPRPVECVMTGVFAALLGAMVISRYYGQIW
ncbi:MAG: cobalt ECF transporter T component CbiQ [Methanobacteriota archaeon]|nr:MAG: cobalt ECF transporter T component CbiQ [Euryarchaeota archaeon]